MLLTVPAAVASGEELGVDFFESKIRPVLVEHCYACHAADAKSVRGGLVLDSRAGAHAGGDSGPAVVPGAPDESLLLDALRYEAFEMPPSGKLPQSVIDDFERWIAAGAPDPRDAPAGETDGGGGMDVEAGRSFWSFQPIRAQTPAEARRADWPATDIDRFLLARMESEGLQPAADADRRTLVRRAHFDLIGLPPSPDTIAAFLADKRPTAAAFAALVDRLLASPQFGVRWGRHWLDVARYAESTGGGRSLLYGSSWRYRDYVIDALNTDKPFDAFVREQIAGDLQPSDDHEQRADRLTATAFLALGPTNYELQDKEQLRMDVVDEQIDTIGRAFLGMTLGCARCHDHKFDPVPTADYYALAGILRSTKTLIHDNVSKWVTQTLPVDPAHQARLDEHAAALAEVDRARKETSESISTLRSELPVLTLDDSEAAVVSGEWGASDRVDKFVGDGYRYASGPDATMRYRLPLAAPGEYEIRVAYSSHSNRSPRALFEVAYADGLSEVRLDQRVSPTFDDLYASLGRFVFGSEAVVSVSTKGASGVVVADAVTVVPVRLERQPPRDQADVAERIQQKIAALETKAAALTTQAEALQAEAPATPPEAMVVADEVGDEVGDCRVCIRGNPKNLGEVVPRGFLTVASRGPPPEVADGVSGRAALADWIASPENPLTARVAANRVWAHLFGQGLVRTVDNFGVAGERPSHPELLDHLASRLIESGWSTKSLIREVMASRAYRLTSEPTGPARAVDPENRLLSHHNRRRLDAEAIHDSLLSLSGRLDPTVGGDTVRPGTKSEYGYEFDVGRRAVYLPVFRNRVADLFAVFDFPDANLSTGRRSTSTLSTQALFMMNSPFVIERAEEASRRLLSAAAESEDERLRLLYERALGRLPTKVEARLARDHLSQSRGGEASAERWAGVCHAVMASVDFRYVP